MERHTRLSTVEDQRFGYHRCSPEISRDGYQSLSETVETVADEGEL